MISILKSVTDLERLDELQQREDLANTTLECYALAIDSSAHYVVEIDPRVAAEFRSHLDVLGQKSRQASSVEQLRTIQASFRGELRDYRDKSVGQLAKMRHEIESATAAMMIFADTVAFNGVNYEQEVQNQLRALDSTSHKESIVEMRGGIASAVTGIELSVDHLKRDNQLVVAQLRDEIRALHEQIEAERKALYTDRASGAWNRQKIDLHIDNLLRQSQPFCLLMVCVRNLKRVESQYSRTVVEGTLQAMTARFGTLIGPSPVIGRWTEDQFIAVLDMLPADAIPLSGEASRKLTGPYAVQENGLAQKVTLQTTAGVIERTASTDGSTFLQKLEQLAGAVAGA